LDLLGIALAHDADDGGEIDGADGFGEAVAGFDEIFLARAVPWLGSPSQRQRKQLFAARVA
jgi:hypothetical protein